MGGGHAQLSVLEALIRRPRPDIDTVLVTPSVYQYYSGMLPGFMVARYGEHECRIDLRRLAERAGIRLHLSCVARICADQRQLILADGIQLDYNWLSVDTGSEPELEQFRNCGNRLLPVKPLAPFFAAWQAKRASAASTGPFRIAVVGAGAAGVEVALAARHSVLGALTPPLITLITGTNGVLADHAPAVRARMLRNLASAEVQLRSGRAIGHPDGLQLEHGELLPAEMVLLAAGAHAPRWLQNAGLALDPAGFIAVDATHRSVSHPEVFAAGDVCARTDLALARSGVHAVRAGPVLAHNLFASIDAGPLKTYRPRKRSLYLIALGEGSAVLSWGTLSAQGRWVMRWKDHIDRAFIRRFTH